ncbi:hypothetical protein H8E88_23120 [candidate division KSB1 bacterium]|nr:hypothetical protein [candidate division KSB1 bacterium]
MREFKSLQIKLVKRRKALEKRLKRLKKQPGRLHKPVSQDFKEQAAERQENEVSDLLDKNAHTELNEINKALIRIKQIIAFC